ncbi:hypothetical protein E2C00_11685 [Streptomyces sp. WAC05374]|uniref:hypothetical protein n=1 Tax=Streptomyces sp. WAC05374 TaxID=2487420 RepID=UPI000F89BA0E|nr:hypothetical protein [Streptomyces sp. WAC05374]RST13785.1 hypothetical protein EF905_19350 [Streptomyces sp. WAC05374]TDF36148.1 hypothetical protein E2B92_31440 [Streptomyces sp. WAC05374]TDF45084.1 hypothetical protein E2C02_33925 [Streptomyces sp. WAC05374]TDF56489.1 hypothetical protein E2C00_11685 [Streptomyces sp. WAC05374]
MPRAGSPWCRFAAAALVLLGALLVCGPGAAGVGAGVGRSAGQSVGEAPGQAAAHDVVTAAGVPERSPGCGPADDEGGLAPAVPPRPGAACELLPALYAARAAAGAWGVDEPAPDVRPERGPPPLAPPSPLDLSILRV